MTTGKGTSEAIPVSQTSRILPVPATDVTIGVCRRQEPVFRYQPIWSRVQTATTRYPTESAEDGVPI